MVEFANIALNPGQGYRLYTNVQAGRAGRRRCPVYEQRSEAIEFLFGNRVFRLRGRLTGCGGARNIIRIRTNSKAATDAIIDAA
jgi:hypothetical protein